MGRKTLEIMQPEMRERHSKAPVDEKTSAQMPSEWLIRSVGERWLSPRQVSLKYSICYEKARQIIREIMGDDIRMSPREKGRKKRPYHLRRVPQSLLEKHIDEFLNG